jgi:hypothetical protein
MAVSTSAGGDRSAFDASANHAPPWWSDGDQCRGGFCRRDGDGAPLTYGSGGPSCAGVYDR